ncbi:MAG: sulfatase [Myxococcota bacterium]
MKRTVPIVVVALLAAAGLALAAWLARAPAVPVVEPKGDPLALGVNVPFERLEIPDDSRGGQPPPETLPLDGPWTNAGRTQRGLVRYTMPVPFRPRGLFFHRAQPGMHVTMADGTELPYKKANQSPTPLWWHDTEQLAVIVPESVDPKTLRFGYRRALERERALNWSMARADELASSVEQFVRETPITEGWQSRRGLLLPAPATASWTITLPEKPVLTMSPGMVRPELGDLGVSDGCSLTVTVTAGDATETVFEGPLKPGEFPIQHVDLSKWETQRVTVTMATDPGATALYDYCFVGEPVIAPRKHDPRRVIVVFVDTLRPDHLSLNGYERQTTPNLDRLARDAVVFDNARSIAPWTLPSARTMVTGRQPEFYDTAETLQARLAAAGFANGMIAGNVYLSANFGMNTDWDYHEVGMFPPANEVTDSALAWLDDHEGQDSLLLVHYMSAHLPYLEPLSYRAMWAGVGPAGLEGEFHLNAVRNARLGNDPEGQQYVRDRYDQCIRWIDDELERLYSQLDDNDILVFLSDHGEEFWDHGGYEHGHSLYEELLRIPLVVKAPGLTPGHVTEPASLLDVTPTILDLLGLPPIAHADGKSLVALANGDPAAREAFAARPHGFGRPLYGFERWGVLDGNRKYTTFQGQESLFDLEADPGETNDLSERNPTLVEPWRARLGEALDRPSGVGFRFQPTPGSSRSQALRVQVHVPGGIAHAWKGEDPLDRSAMLVTTLDEETVELVWLGGRAGTREAYVLPIAPVEEVTHEMVVTVVQGERRCRLQVPRNLAASPGRSRKPFAQAAMPQGTLRVGWSMAPAPPEGAHSLDAMDPEMAGSLEVIGYMFREGDDEGTPMDLTDVQPCGG